jgi:hypothetical protein
MTDQANSLTPPAATLPAAGAASQPNPLDALEAILQEAKAKAGAASAGAMPGAANEAVATTDAAAVAAEEEAKKLADLEALQSENRIQDEENLKAELAKLSRVSDSSEEKARVQQNQDQEKSQVDKQQQRDEYLIRQLGHTKI